ncbi:MAG: hypothetical protein QXH35_04705 [Nitrososphaerota archaeon]
MPEKVPGLGAERFDGACTCSAAHGQPGCVQGHLRGPGGWH